MIYTDSENRRWWDGLTKKEQTDLLELIVEKATTPKVNDWAETLLHIHNHGGKLTDKNLASIRKWAK
jgi:hypothetical protein